MAQRTLFVDRSRVGGSNQPTMCTPGKPTRRLLDIAGFSDFRDRPEDGIWIEGVPVVEPHVAPAEVLEYDHLAGARIMKQSLDPGGRGTTADRGPDARGIACPQAA